MKKLAKIAKTFLDKLNELIKTLNNTKINSQYYNELLNNIRLVKALYVFDESVIMKNIKNHDFSINKQNVLTFVCKDEIKIFMGKVCKTVQHKLIKDVNFNCVHSFPNIKFSNTFNLEFIDDEESFRKMLPNLDLFLIDVYDHSYRTYIPYVCYLIILNTKGDIFIVNCIKLRTSIIEAGLFTCKYKKIFSNLESYKKLLVDFKNISCFKVADFYAKNDFMLFDNFKLTPKTYIDWRIEHIQYFLKDYIYRNITFFCNSLDYVNYYDEPSFPIQSDLLFFYTEKDELNFIKKDEDFLYLEKDTKYFEIFKRYLVCKYLLEDNKYLDKLIRSREYIAKNINESIYYVMTNDQLSFLAKVKYKKERDFVKNEVMCSSVVKQNLNLFLFTDSLD